MDSCRSVSWGLTEYAAYTKSLDSIKDLFEGLCPIDPNMLALVARTYFPDLVPYYNDKQIFDDKCTLDNLRAVIDILTKGWTRKSLKHKVLSWLGMPAPDTCVENGRKIDIKRLYGELGTQLNLYEKYCVIIIVISRQISKQIAKSGNPSRVLEDTRDILTVRRQSYHLLASRVRCDEKITKYTEELMFTNIAPFTSLCETRISQFSAAIRNMFININFCFDCTNESRCIHVLQDFVSRVARSDLDVMLHDATLNNIVSYFPDRESSVLNFRQICDKPFVGLDMATPRLAKKFMSTVNLIETLPLLGMLIFDIEAMVAAKQLEHDRLLKIYGETPEIDPEYWEKRIQERMLEEADIYNPPSPSPFPL